MNMATDKDGDSDIQPPVTLDPGWNAPLWLAQLTSDEPQREPDPEDAFEVKWWGSFEKSHLSDSMAHAYKPICSNWRWVQIADKKIRRYHAFGKSCCSGGKPKKDHGPCAHAP